MERSWLPYLRSPSDDWTGVTDQQRRRRLQNRLAQRASRAKHAKTKPVGGPSQIEPHGRPGEAQVKAMQTKISKPDGHNANDTLLGNIEYVATNWLSQGPTMTPSEAVFNGKGFEHFNLYHPIYPEIGGTCLQPQTLSTYVMTLSSMNTVAAFWRNADVIGLDCASMHGVFLAIPERMAELPVALKPTALQGRVPHRTLIDCIPFPSMRDRILASLPHLDMASLRHDLVFSGIKCWGQRPWDARGWELPPVFAERWWWLLDQDILDMTNFWREERDEAPLIWKGADIDQALADIIKDGE